LKRIPGRRGGGTYTVRSARKTSIRTQESKVLLSGSNETNPEHSSPAVSADKSANKTPREEKKILQLK